jgi:hypothetical protein
LDTATHPLDPRDKALLLPPAPSQTDKVQKAARPIVTWLRRTEYITGTKNSNQQYNNKRDARQSGASSVDDPVAVINSTFEYNEDLGMVFEDWV